MMKFSKLAIKGSQEEIQSKDIKIGDILVVYENDTFPSDLVLLKSSGGQNAFIQTSSLDGEKNLKKRNIPINFADYVKPPEEKDLPLLEWLEKKRNLGELFFWCPYEQLLWMEIDLNNLINVLENRILYRL